MTPDDIRHYKLEYHQGTLKPFFISLCPPCLSTRLTNGASVLEKRIPVSKAACADCDPRGALRT